MLSKDIIFNKSVITSSIVMLSVVIFKAHVGFLGLDMLNENFHF